jgi:hypothetical protein
MKRIGMLAALALAITTALFISACSKKSEPEVSQAPEQTSGTPETPAPATDQSATTQEPAPATETPAATEAPRGHTRTHVRTTTKTTSGSTEGSKAVAASQPKTAEIPVGTIFDVTMDTPADTRTSNVGDKVDARLAAPLTNSAGVVIAEQGAVLHGEVSQLQRASRSKSEEDRASIAFTFTSIQTVDGEKALHATVMNSEGKLVAKGTGTRDKLLIGGGAVAGAVIGKLAGKDTKSTVLGAVGGAVAGTGAVLMAKGHELEVPTGSKVQLRVDEPITVVEK